MLKNSYILTFFIFLGCVSIKPIDDSHHSLFNNNKEISLKEKIAQMIMIRSNGEFLNDSNWRKGHIENLIVNYKIGGIITFTGSTHGTFYNIQGFQNLSDIPLFVAADYERGLGTFIDGTLFPPNMAVAATGNPDFAYKQGQIIAKEAKSIGVNMIFAPVVDINNNFNNPIINIRSYSDNKDTVIKYSVPFIKGIQENNIIACAKHYPGHGNTSTDSHTSLPIINIDKDELYNNELAPFKEACLNKVESIMVGHILIPSIDNKYPATFSKRITNDILRNKWKYEGLIITDALEMGALTSTTWNGESAIRAIEAGADIILLPLDGIKAINAIYNAVLSGRIKEERINDSYNRIIEKKKNMNLFKNTTNWDNVEKIVGIKEHTRVASDIAQKSITIVKNKNNLIPFIPYKYNKIVHLLLSTDNDLRTRMKPFVRDVNYIHGNVETIYVNDQLSDYGMKDILKKIENSDFIIASMLIRIKMDKGLSTIDETHNILLNKIKNLNIPIVGVSFGSPYLPDYNNLDSYLCTYGYGSVSMSAATNALFGRAPITGKLPIDLNEKYKIGFGIEVKKNNKVFESNIKINLEEPIKIIQDAIEDKIFPGAQIFISKGENILFNDGIGHLTYHNHSEKVDTKTLYDVASLTKVLSTTAVIMKLVQKKIVGLDFPLSDFYPEFKTDLKEKITIRHLLTHTSGLKAYVEYYKNEEIYNKADIINDIVNQKLEYDPGSKVVYSDLGMILLCDVIEKITNTSLDKLAKSYYYNPLGMNNTLYNPDFISNKNIAPTEFDDYFRNKLLQGEVHDENAYLLDGVTGHSGLFSNAEDIGKYSKLLLNEGVYLGRRYIKKNIIKSFTKRVDFPINSERTLGWDTPSRNGRSTAGDYFSTKTFGHLGFTGTSLWIDPEKKIIVVLLTNRVYPTRNNSGIYNVRRDFHNSLVRIIEDI